MCGLLGTEYVGREVRGLVDRTQLALALAQHFEEAGGPVDGFVHRGDLEQGIGGNHLLGLREGPSISVTFPLASLTRLPWRSAAVLRVEHHARLCDLLDERPHPLDQCLGGAPASLSLSALSNPKMRIVDLLKVSL